MKSKINHSNLNNATPLKPNSRILVDSNNKTPQSKQVPNGTPRPMNNPLVSAGKECMSKGLKVFDISIGDSDDIRRVFLEFSFIMDRTLADCPSPPL